MAEIGTILAILVASVVAVLALTYTELAMVLFLTAPIVKLAIMVAFPVARTYDYTAAVLILLAVSIGLHVARRGLEGTKLFGGMFGLIVTMLLMMGFTYAYTPAPNYGMAKLVRAAIVIPVGFIVPILYLRTERQARRLMMWSVLVSIVVALGTIISPTPKYTHVSGRGTFLESNPLSTAASIGFGLLFALALAFDPSVSRRLRTGLLVSLPVLFLGVFFTGSRGPLINVLFCSMLYLLIQRRQLGVGKGMLVVVVGLAAAAAVSWYLPEAYWGRFLQVFGLGGYGEFGADRRALWAAALSGGMESPVLGNGIGSFGFAVGVGDGRAYPHNIFLELFYEGGIMAAALGVAAIASLLFTGWRLIKSQESTSLRSAVLGFYLVMLFTFLESLKSGDLSDNRRIWFWAGAMLGCANVANLQQWSLAQEDELALSEAIALGA